MCKLRKYDPKGQEDGNLTLKRLVFNLAHPPEVFPKLYLQETG